MSKDTGGPAFPETRWDDRTRQEVQWTGMELRDYFAAKAMQAAIGMYNGNSFYDEGGCTFSRTAEAAYEMADAMLKTRGE